MPDLAVFRRPRRAHHRRRAQRVLAWFSQHRPRGVRVRVFGVPLPRLLVCSGITLWLLAVVFLSIPVVTR